jgi:solute carrier family 35 protein C2
MDSPQHHHKIKEQTAVSIDQNISLTSTKFPSIALTRLPTSQNPTECSSDDIQAPDAAAALSGIQTPDRKMSEPSGHRRRRSSGMSNLEGSSKGKPRRASVSPTKKDPIAEEPKVTDGLLDEDNKSTSEDLEMENFTDDGLQDDEETGLTGKHKGKRKEKKRRNTLLDHRIASDSMISDEEKKQADQNVFRAGIVNAILIALWYVFSLSISIVSVSIVYVFHARLLTG